MSVIDPNACALQLAFSYWDYVRVCLAFAHVMWILYGSEWPEQCPLHNCHDHVSPAFFSSSSTNHYARLVKEPRVQKFIFPFTNDSLCESWTLKSLATVK